MSPERRWRIEKWVGAIVSATIATVSLVAWVGETVASLQGANQAQDQAIADVKAREIVIMQRLNEISRGIHRIEGRLEQMDRDDIP